jgi:SsrA-binding protein
MSDQSVAVNRQAYFNYFISDKLEAGIVLSGAEVKSVREGKANLKDAYVRFSGVEVFVVGMHISPYSHTASINDDDPTRSRKLLLHQKEIAHLQGLMAQKGFTCIPLSLYFKRGIAKLEIGVAKGKKQYDKRESIKNKEHARELRQALKHRSK